MSGSRDINLSNENRILERAFGGKTDGNHGNGPGKKLTSDREAPAGAIKGNDIFIIEINCRLTARYRATCNKSKSLVEPAFWTDKRSRRRKTEKMADLLGVTKVRTLQRWEISLNRII